MRIELTEQSGFEVNNLAAADMTPAMAARYLEGKIHIRGFEEFLRQLYPGRDLKERLIFALTEQGCKGFRRQAGAQLAAGQKSPGGQGRSFSDRIRPWV